MKVPAPVADSTPEKAGDSPGIDILVWSLVSCREVGGGDYGSVVPGESGVSSTLLYQERNDCSSQVQIRVDGAKQ
jgi:hypothetical protein